MKRRRMVGRGLVALVMVAGLIGMWAMTQPAHPDVTAADAGQVRVGMTLAEVEGLFGGPPDQIDPRPVSKPPAGRGGPPFGQMAIWEGESAVIRVGLMDEVVVFSDAEERPPQPRPSRWQRTRAQLGL